jgi:hypothetical protein
MDLADDHEDSPPQNPVSMMSENLACFALQRIFRLDELATGNAETLQSTLDIFRKFPRLVFQHYNNGEPGVQQLNTPLGIFINAGLGSDAIQEILTMNRRAISEKQGVDHCLPLHLACKYGRNYRNIKFLLDAHPRAICERDRKGYLPLDYLLDRHPRFDDAIKLLLDEYPHISAKKRFSRRSLMLAVLNGCSPWVVERLFEKACPDKRFSVHIDFRIDTDQVNRLAMILPRLTRFHCYTSDFTCDGFVRLMECLTNNKSIRRAFLSLPRLMSPQAETGDDRNSHLKRLFQENVVLEDLILSITAPDEDSLSGKKTLQYIGESLGRNQTLKSFCLEGCWNLSTGGLCKFITEGFAPDLFFLKKVRVSGDDIGNHAEQKCRVRKLSLLDCDISSDCIGKVISRIPLLTDMVIYSRSSASGLYMSVDLTEAANMILRSGVLRRLTILGYQLDFVSFCESLKTNTTLESLTLDKVVIRGNG